jgi:hypothetical protein
VWTGLDVGPGGGCDEALLAGGGPQLLRDVRRERREQLDGGDEGVRAGAAVGGENQDGRSVAELLGVADNERVNWLDEAVDLQRFVTQGPCALGDGVGQGLDDVLPGTQLVDQAVDQVAARARSLS